MRALLETGRGPAWEWLMQLQSRAAIGTALGTGGHIAPSVVPEISPDSFFRGHVEGTPTSFPLSGFLLSGFLFLRPQPRFLRFHL
jgi:hypothetical protein